MKSRVLLLSLLVGAISVAALNAQEPAVTREPNDPEKPSTRQKEAPERSLDAIGSRCRKMLNIQTAVHKGTRNLHKVIEGNDDKKPRPEDKKTALELSSLVKNSIAEVDRVIAILEPERAAFAFLEVVRGLRGDMRRVRGRLEMADVGPDTQDLEEKIIETLKEMVQAVEGR
jgi:hypothetical protein